MTDTQSRPDHGPSSWGPLGGPPVTGSMPPRPGPYGPAAPWTGVYPPPVGPPTPPPSQSKGRRTVLRVLVVIAAVVFGLPGALVVAAIIAAVATDEPSSTDSTPATAPPSIEASTAPETVAPSPPPEPDPLEPYDLAPGDCFNNSVLPPADGSTVSVDTVEPVPCAEPHNSQVVARFTYTGAFWSATTDSRSADDCARSFRTFLPRKIYNDDRYRLMRIHPDRAAPGLQSVYAACVIATDAPTTGSVVKG